MYRFSCKSFDIDGIEEGDFEIKETETPSNGYTQDDALTIMPGISDSGSLPQGKKSVKTRDSEGNTLTAEQAEYFKDSKARDEDGNLLVLWHGSMKSKSGGKRITTFRTYTQGEVNDFTGEAGWERYGAFTSTNKDVALNFSGFNSTVLTKGNHSNKVADGVYKLYANVVNPFIVDADGAVWDMLNLDGYEDLRTADDVTSYAYENGYDGAIIRNVREGTGTSIGDDVVVFNSNQLKYADNKIPTGKSDMLILYS